MSSRKSLDSAALADLRRTMTMWHNRVTALGLDGVSDLIALAEAGSEEMKKAWPIGERIELKLMMIKKIAEGSTTANSLPHLSRIADEAIRTIQAHRAAISNVEGGDAFWLATILNLSITQCPRHTTPHVSVRYIPSSGEVGHIIEHYNGDAEAATRLAIVRAASEIGRAML